MARIERFLDLCRSHTEAEFRRIHPYPVLVHCSITGGLTPATSPSASGGTLDRMVVGFGPMDPTLPGADANEPEQGEQESNTEELYTIFVLEPKGDNHTVTIGCSRRADVQIEDQSISGIHARFKVRGKTVSLRDNDSSAGTQVNDKLLLDGKEKVLDASDRISLGYVDLIFLPPAHFYHFLRRQLSES